MSSNPVALLLGLEQSQEDAIRAAVEDTPSLRLLAVHRLGPALARLSGGDVAVVVVADSFLHESKADIEPALRKLTAASSKPIVLLLDAADEALKACAQRVDGIIELLTVPGWQTRVQEIVRSAVRQHEQDEAGNHAWAAAAGNGQVIAFMGAKGGSGVTTVASNVALELSRRATVVLAEIQAAPGSLASYFRLSPAVQTLEHVMATSPRELDSKFVDKLLWSNATNPKLRFLFSSQNLDCFGELAPKTVEILIRRLSALADFVLLDLPPVLGSTTRAVLRESSVLALVVERDILALEAAESKLRYLCSAAIAPQHIGVVIVNKAALGAPIDINEFESRLGVELFGSVPPAPDLCASANRAHLTVSAMDAGSSVARSLAALAVNVTSGVRNAFSTTDAR